VWSAINSCLCVLEVDVFMRIYEFRSIFKQLDDADDLPINPDLFKV